MDESDEQDLVLELFKRPDFKHMGGKDGSGRAITPISDGEHSPGPVPEGMDNTLDQYIEDLRLANKQADLRMVLTSQQQEQSCEDQQTLSTQNF